MRGLPAENCDSFSMLFEMTFTLVFLGIILFSSSYLLIASYYLEGRMVQMSFWV